VNQHELSFKSIDNTVRLSFSLNEIAIALISQLRFCVKKLRAIESTRKNADAVVDASIENYFAVHTKYFSTIDIVRERRFVA